MQMTNSVRFSFDSNPTGKLLRKLIFNKSSCCVTFESRISFFFSSAGVHSACWVFNLHTNATSCFNCWWKKSTAFFGAARRCFCDDARRWFDGNLLRIPDRKKSVTQDNFQCSAYHRGLRVHWVMLSIYPCSDGSRLQSSSRARGDIEPRRLESHVAWIFFYRLWTRKSKW